MTKRRKMYVVKTTYKAIKTYELLAHDAEEAKQLIRDSHRVGLTTIDETFNVDHAYRKERQ